MGLCSSRDFSTRDVMYCNSGHVPVECGLQEQTRSHGFHSRKTVKRYFCHVCGKTQQKELYSMDITQERRSSFDQTAFLSKEMNGKD